MAGGFILPGATGEGEIIDPAAVLRRRRIVDAMLEKGTDFSPVQSPWQGLARVANAGLGGFEAGHLDKEEADAKTAARASTAEMFKTFPSAVSAVTSAMSDPVPENAEPRQPTFVGLSGANPSSARKISGTNADFVSAMTPHALEASKATGVDPRIILAQSAIETGWGRSAPGNNYFGIKSHGEPGGNTMATTEVVNGQPVRVSDSFRAFPSMAESAAGYSRFINENPRYAGLKQAQGLEAQAAALQKSGYATDPAYGSKVLSVARSLADIPAEGAVPAEFRVPGEAPAQTAGQAGVTAALNGSVPPERLAAAQRVLANPYAPKSAQAIAQSIVTKALTPQEPKMTAVAPGSSLVDERTGRVVYEAPDRDRNKPMTVAPGASVYDPRSGQSVYTAPDRDKSIENERKGREEASSLRKEIHTLPSYKNYSQAQPVYQGMVETAGRDSKASDLNLVYGLGKIMDPGSVVREGEIQMAQDTQGLGDRLNGMIRGIMGGARLSPDARQQILTEAYGRMQSYETAYNQDATGYRAIISRGGMNEADVLPNFVAVKPYVSAAPAATADAAKTTTAPTPGKKTIGGKTYVQRDGKWFEE